MTQHDLAVEARGTPTGLALYVRRITRRRHGAPEAFARRCADHGLQWIAIGGPWQERGDDGRVRTRLINPIDVCRRYMDALAEAGVEPWVWGYPWLGEEEAFADAMASCAGDHRRAILDPELGANPSKARRGDGKLAAEAGARELVGLMADRFDACGLSTYGSGVRLKWFPLYAYARALVERFEGRTFIGGQTYTVDEQAVDRSTADFARAAERVAGEGWRSKIEVVPNFGTYSRVGGKVRAKSAEELHWHLSGFVDDGEEIRALIGWAENFVGREQWKVLARWADWLHRGACTLPAVG